MKSWGFYGRSTELEQLRRILLRGRWFFCAVSGRRRIGKTALIKRLREAGDLPKVFYFQVPDSDERGVVQAFWDALEDYGVDSTTYSTFKTFHDITRAIRNLCRQGWVVVMDEFQYFHRARLAPFTSYLQEAVDELRDTHTGGFVVLGSIHTEMMAILEDRQSPLFNRVTDRLEVEHLDLATVFELLHTHGLVSPKDQLFLWSMFEGVPKFYRDCFEQGVFDIESSGEEFRVEVLRRLFFEGTSPLKDEATNWFLRELRGKYDTVLKILARHGPCPRGTITEEYRRAGDASTTELGGYLAALVERYRMVEALQPILSAPGSRKARYAITDNFLTAWLQALERNVQRSRVQPMDAAIRRAEVALQVHEGFALEKFVRLALEETSRKGVGDFQLTRVVRGYWNKQKVGAGIEIDVVAVNEDERTVRFGSCKRSARAHGASLGDFRAHVERFRRTKDGRRLSGWTEELALYSPVFPPELRAKMEPGFRCYDFADFSEMLGAGNAQLPLVQI